MKRLAGVLSLAVNRREACGMRVRVVDEYMPMSKGNSRVLHDYHVSWRMNTTSQDRVCHDRSVCAHSYSAKALRRNPRVLSALETSRGF
jgi:hypothetical protein